MSAPGEDMTPWRRELPRAAAIGGRAYPVRSDYRAVLDVVQVMGDREVTDEERTVTALTVFYEGFEDMPPRDWQEAVDWMQWFVACGESQGKRGPKLMDWEQDFGLIVAPMNRVLGFDVRGVPEPDPETGEGGLHWWTFVAAYREIGDCQFAQVVSIRKKRSKGKKLDKADAAFYAENRELVDFRRRETAAESAALSKWTGA